MDFFLFLAEEERAVTYTLSQPNIAILFIAYIIAMTSAGIGSAFELHFGSPVSSVLSSVGMYTQRGMPRSHASIETNRP